MVGIVGDGSRDAWRRGRRVAPEVVGDRDGQHPAERPQGAPRLGCRGEQGDGARIGEQGLHLPGIGGGSRREPDQPADAFGQRPPSPGRPAGRGWKTMPGRRLWARLRPGDERGQPRRQPAEPAEDQDQHRPDEAIDRDPRRGGAAQRVDDEGEGASETGCGERRGHERNKNTMRTMSQADRLRDAGLSRTGAALACRLHRMLEPI
jgi:hypothetical protein